MKILLLCDVFNCLSQRIFASLSDEGHQVTVELSVSPQIMSEAVTMFRPDLIIAPMLTKKIPAEVWQNYTCLVVHPGIKGDRGPSSLDWAIMEGQSQWGVTILQAAEEMDAGDIWWSKTFALELRSKSSIYRREVTRLAHEGVLFCVEQFLKKGFTPEPLDYQNPTITGKLKPFMKPKIRAIDWQQDGTAVILQKINSGDSQPGAVATLLNKSFHLFNAMDGVAKLAATPGHVLSKVGDGVLVATLDGSIIVNNLRPVGPCSEHIKLAATNFLPKHDVPQSQAPGIFIEEIGDVAWLYFDFYNGAMGTHHCRHLQQAYESLLKKKPRAVVLMGGGDFFSNGINLNTIEAASDPAEEAWQNILSMNNLVHSILTTPNILTIAMLRANAGAGGVMMALAADLVWADPNVVLNPHYKAMGGLYGSEYWTYSLPKRVGLAMAQRLTDSLLPLSAAAAWKLGLVDQIMDSSKPNLLNAINLLLKSERYHQIIHTKNQRFLSKDWLHETNACVERELAMMRQNFFDPESPFHQARKNFVYKIPPRATPLHLAKHRR